MLVVSIVLTCVLALGGCGGDEGKGAEATAGEETSTSAAGAASGEERRQLKSHNDSGGGAAQFENARTAGTVVEFGEEADAEDFEAVAAALHGYLDAKEAQDWGLSCEYMSREAIESIAQFAADPDASCPELLEEFSSGTSPKILRRLAVADVGSVRILGNEAHALYKGAKGFGFFMPMVFEEGQWKVRSLAPSMLP